MKRRVRFALIAAVLAAISVLVGTVGASRIAAGDGQRPTAGQARVIPVRSTIQAALDAAQPGDVVLVPAGTYRENVVVATDGISIVGLPGAVLDGTGVAGPVGIRVAPPAAAE